MDFEPVNVPGDPAAQAELERLGVPRVPATVVGRAVVHGWNPRALARLVGVEFSDGPALSPGELAGTLDRILAFARHGLAAAPPEALGVMKGGRRRTLRELGYHLVRVAEAFVDAMEQGHYPADWISDYGPASVRSGEQLAAHAARARERLRRWFAAAPADVFGRSVDTYYGAQTAHELLERSAWHAAQHLRQVYDVLADQGVLPPGSLDDTIFEGLPVPEDVW